MEAVTWVRTLNDSLTEISLDIGKIARSAAYFREALKKFTPDTFTDTRYYPPPGDPEEDVLRYFIFMVAIDHRTSRFNDFEGYVNGEFYHGADLLYRLGMLKYSENPAFFSPDRMSRISDVEVAEWLSVTDSRGRRRTIWDPQVRAALLRDIGRRLIALYGGRVSELIRKSGGYLKRPYGLGIIDRLKAFRAYSDPVEKKAYLLIKFISRRGLFKYHDVVNSEVPVDNHLTRIALRLGFVKPRGIILRKLELGQPFSWEEDVTLRMGVRKSYKILSNLIHVNPLELDDFLWLFGRHCCTYSSPTCVQGCTGKCKELGFCNDEGCLFKDLCGDHPSLIKEHNYRDTYYY
jgi:hypothetical protein